MGQTRFIKKIFFTVFIAASLLILCSCGTTGKIRFYDYNVSKDTLQSAIKKFLIANPQYRFPVNDTSWNAYAPEDSVPDYSVEKNHLAYSYIHLSDKEEYIYFKDKPEELYQLGYYMNKEYWAANPHYSRLALVGVVKKGGKWQYSDFIFNKYIKGKSRIEKRLEDEILNKLPYKFEKIE